MRLLVIRHAIAKDREEFARTGRPDAERPLTRGGRDKMRRGAAGLAAVVPELDVLASSPLVRALQTAELVADEYGGLPVVTVTELAPERSPDDLLPWLRALPAAATAAVVGHEPHLSLLVGWLLTGRPASFMELKKGGACLVELDDPPAAGSARLRWALAPAHLRELG